MSIQLSLFWQAVDQLEWYWAGDTDVYTGSFEELQDQRQSRNMEACLVRLFLPASWFSTIAVQLPGNARRVSPQMLKFAAEEFLAQDIDSVHLVMKNKPVNGVVSVEATDIERLRQILNTLNTRQFIVTEAYNAQLFNLNDTQTDDLLLQIQGDQVTLTMADDLYTVHARGFSQWFELWASQNKVPEDASIRLVSDSAEGPAKAIATEFEAVGYQVQWTVEAQKRLVDWHDQAELYKGSANLITGPFSQRSGHSNLKIWLPTVIAASVLLVLWSVLTVLTNIRNESKVEQAWQASEQVFLQVFGQDKRIQRPLMVREMRSRAASSGATDSEGELNALVFLRDINNAAASFTLEDFRFNKQRNEAFFTLVQPVSETGDAYSLFESLKSDLSSKNYQVEYSANQDKDSYRAQFKMVYGGQG